MHNVNNYLESCNEKLQNDEMDIEAALIKARSVLKSYSNPTNVIDFDVRGELYALALKLAPKARSEELYLVLDLLKPIIGEVGVDLAAGTGYLSRALVKNTNSLLYAVDLSKKQLSELSSSNKEIKTISLSPDSPNLRSYIAESSVDFFTSIGGLHHVDSHKLMFENISLLLKSGGRFVAADVCSNTNLSRHFDDVVSTKCITGHSANWLSCEKLQGLANDTNLSLESCQMVNIKWHFNSELEMALFFKALHAYDIPLSEILVDLSDQLGYLVYQDSVVLNWPLMVFKIIKG